MRHCQPVRLYLNGRPGGSIVDAQLKSNVHSAVASRLRPAWRLQLVQRFQVCRLGARWADVMQPLEQEAF